MPPSGSVEKICMRCEKTESQLARLGQRLKRCAGCSGDGLDFLYCSDNCYTADWQDHKRRCQNREPLPLGVNGRVLRAHLDSWFTVYKAMLEWTVHQFSLTQTGDSDSNHSYLVIELDYFEGAPEFGVPCLHSTRLNIRPQAADSNLLCPFREQGAKIIECILKWCRISHRCASRTLDSLRDVPPCTRWNYVVADMVALGFQNEEQMEKSLPLVITRHNMFEAFVGADSPLSREPFPRLSRSLPPELGVGPWIWIKDQGFTAWFTRATGKTIAARVTELETQASQDKCLERLLQWAMDPESPTLESLGMNIPRMPERQHPSSGHRNASSF